ncbi:NAD(P)H-dependent flavin oxidoreductase [Mycobacterium sp. C31M]
MQPRKALWPGRLTLPAIAAPMTSVSGPELVTAACRAGVIGAFPTHNAPSTADLHTWLHTIATELASADSPTAPMAPNLVVHRSNTRLDADLDCLLEHRPELVITSVGSPAPAVAKLHAVGTAVYADVASLQHAWRALDAGADGLILLTAGAGGQTGWANPFAFVRAVRERYEGPVVLAGGISDGTAILAAQALGVDLTYLGTRFIATHQSAASDGYRHALVQSTLDDVRLSDRVGGIPASLLACWLEEQQVGAELAGFSQDQLLDNRTAWSAGHSVSGIAAITDVADLVADLVAQYHAARNSLRELVIDG